MTTALVLIDGGHLLAAAGRSLGFGPQRAAGRFDVRGLVAAVHALVPRSVQVTRTVWYDGLVGESRDLERLRGDAGITVVALPVTGGRQRHVETSVLRDVLVAAEDGVARLYLVGDPRRHALALESAAESGTEVVVVGVSDGERTPAARIWLRRPELSRTVRERRTGPPRRRDAPAEPAARSGVDRPAYLPPAARAFPVRLPRAPLESPGTTPAGDRDG